MAIYVYCITYDHRYQSSIKGRRFENDWLSLQENGVVTVKGSYYQGYAWDGCSPKLKIKDIYFGTAEALLNPETGHSKTYYASLIHDVLYQFSFDMRRCVSRKEADNEFYAILRRDRFSFARLYYIGVRMFGWIFWAKPR